MNSELKHMRDVWELPHNKGTEATELPKLSFDSITNSIIALGPFYYYVIDFYDMSLSHVSPSIKEILGFDHETVSFNDILSTLHPNDIEYSFKAESTIADFFGKNIKREKLTKYKMMYNLTGRIANGEYVLFNHQAIMLTLDSKGGFGKSLNIHTRIDHLCKVNSRQVSIVGLDGEPSYLDISVDKAIQDTTKFSKREIDVIKCLSDGLNSDEIAEKLFISSHTVKKHRDNILSKSNSKTTAQLIKNCVLQGLI